MRLSMALKSTGIPVAIHLLTFPRHPSAGAGWEVCAMASMELPVRAVGAARKGGRWKGCWVARRACRARALAALWRAHKGRQRIFSLQKAWHGRPRGEWAQRTGCIGARASRERREFAGLLAACASCAEAIVPQRCVLGGRKVKPLYDDSWEAAAATAHGAREVNSADVPEI